MGLNDSKHAMTDEARAKNFVNEYCRITVVLVEC